MSIKKETQISYKSRFVFGIWMIALVAVVIRLVALAVSHAPVGEADSTIRVFYSIAWLQDPYIFCPTTWPPLQFYIYGLALAAYFDPIYTPLVVNILLSGILVVSLGYIVRRLMDSDEAGLFAGLMIAVYPLSIRYSLIAQPEVILNCLIAGSLLFLLRAASGNEDRKISVDDIIAAVLMALACWTHMEAWFLAPIFSLLLWGHWKRFVVFSAIVAVPVLFFIVHTQSTYGGVPSAWYGYSHGASSTVRQLLYYPALLVKTMTPAIVLMAVVGLIHVIQTRLDSWKLKLFPALCLVLLTPPYLFFVFAWDRTKPKEALLLSLFIIPYAALGLVQVKNLFKGRLAQWLVVVAAITMMLAAPYNWKYLSYGGIFPIPRTSSENVKTANWLNRHMAPGDGVVFDHLPQYADFYMASAIRALPDQVLLTLEWPPEEVKRRLELYLEKQQPEYLVLSKPPGTVSRLLALECTSDGCPENFWDPLFQAFFKKRFETENYIIYARSMD